MVLVSKYHIEYYDDIAEKIYTEHGIVFGSTFSGAMRNLEEYYGKENIQSILELKNFNLGGEYVLPEDAFKALGYKLSAKESD